MNLPQLRATAEPYRSAIWQAVGKRSEAWDELAVEMYARGLSTRDIEELLGELCEQEGQTLLDDLHHPQLRSAMLAVNDELMADADVPADGGGDQLAVDSLANLLAVHLIRHLGAPRAMSNRGAARRVDAALSPQTLRSVLGFIEEHLRSDLTPEQMAATAYLSPFHFARQFKTTTGVPPHQYVIARRVELAKQLLQHPGDLQLSEVATRAGFSDQSHFTSRFKRLVGVTPGQFRASARTS